MIIFDGEKGEPVSWHSDRKGQSPNSEMRGGPQGQAQKQPRLPRTHFSPGAGGFHVFKAISSSPN